MLKLKRKSSILINDEISFDTKKKEPKRNFKLINNNLNTSKKKLQNHYKRHKKGACYEFEKCFEREVIKNSDETILKVGLIRSEESGDMCLDLREYYNNAESGEKDATMRGVMIPIEEIENLISILNIAKEVCKEENFFEL